MSDTTRCDFDPTGYSSVDLATPLPPFAYYPEDFCHATATVKARGHEPVRETAWIEGPIGAKDFLANIRRYLSSRTLGERSADELEWAEYRSSGYFSHINWYRDYYRYDFGRRKLHTCRSFFASTPDKTSARITLNIRLKDGSTLHAALKVRDWLWDERDFRGVPHDEHHGKPARRLLVRKSSAAGELLAFLLDGGLVPECYTGRDAPFALPQASETYPLEACLGDRAAREAPEATQKQNGSDKEAHTEDTIESNWKLLAPTYGALAKRIGHAENVESVEYSYENYEVAGEFHIPDSWEDEFPAKSIKARDEGFERALTHWCKQLEGLFEELELYPEEGANATEKLVRRALWSGDVYDLVPARTIASKLTTIKIEVIADDEEVVGNEAVIGGVTPKSTPAPAIAIGNDPDVSQALRDWGLA